MSRMIVAGDIGGTKTLLGLFEPGSPRPRPRAVRSYTTNAFNDLATMLSAFLRDADAREVGVASASFGVAGPINGDTASLTNVGWTVDRRAAMAALKCERASLINDLEAMAYGVTVLEPPELEVLQKGSPASTGNMAVIAAGTGLGQALLHKVNGRFIPSPTEAGHAGFAARTEPEINLLRDLMKRLGHASVENVLSGPGLINIHRVTHGPHACGAAIDIHSPEAPQAITTAALERRCALCVDTLSLFVDAYGAEAGNLALRALATGGVFVGGGIATKILAALTTGAFINAFRAKPPFESMLSSIPVYVILNPEAGLVGAAVAAAALTRGT